MRKPNTLFYLLIGASIGSLLPDPSDIVAFQIQSYLFTHPGTSTVWYWFLSVVSFYGLSSLYYALLAGIVYWLHVKNTARTKTIAILASVVATGVIFTIIWRSIGG